MQMLRRSLILALVLSSLAMAQDTKPAGPYSSWTHGPPSDPAFFPIAVWLQATNNAAKYRDAGINTYVALWRGPTAEQFDALKAAGMKLVCHQNELGLQRKDDPTIIAWEVMNEPRGNGLDEHDHGEALTHFIHEIASALHVVAPHQLVLAGDEGFYQGVIV